MEVEYKYYKNIISKDCIILQTIFYTNSFCTVHIYKDNKFIYNNFFTHVSLHEKNFLSAELYEFLKDYEEISQFEYDEELKFSKI
jgi:hypothetical protein